MFKSRFIIFPALALMFVSCAREALDSPQNVQTTITAYMADGKEKSTLIDGGSKVYWEAGDQISAFIGGSNYRFASLNKKQSETAVFGTSDKITFAPVAGNDYLLWAVYPYSEDNGFDGTALTATLPFAQQARAGSFSSGSNIVMGRANEMNVGFRNVTGGVRFSLVRDDIQSVAFVATGGEAVAGRFKATFAGDIPVVSGIIDGKNAISLTAPDGDTFETGKWYYMNALPAELAGGFEMCFATATGHGTLTHGSAVTISRGVFGSMENVDKDITFIPGIKILELVLSKYDAEIYIGETVGISGTPVPCPSPVPAIVWASDNNAVATVTSNGVISGIGEGTTTVHAKCGDAEAAVNVTVKKRDIPRDPIVRKISLTGSECPFADQGKAEYGIYIPPTWERLNAVLVMQHGCGMEVMGITRNTDVQWQAFAYKWGVMIVEAAIYGNCGLWHNPESGSAKAIFDIIDRMADEEYHPELKTAPLLLWGHSSGGFWTLGMLRDYPERILALCTYSAAWNPQWAYQPEVSNIPILMRHAGDRDGSPDISCEATANHTFEVTRAMDAPSIVALDPTGTHNDSRVRHIFIPFYEAALQYRLPTDGVHMRPLDPDVCWLGNPKTHEIFPEKGYASDKSHLCRFANQYVAQKWVEFVETGDVADVTPPEAPYFIEYERLSPSQVLIRWKAWADVESGIKDFIIRVNGSPAGLLPANGSVYQKFDTNGDNAYPAVPPAMEMTVTAPAGSVVSVQTENQFGLLSDTVQIDV